MRNALGNWTVVAGRADIFDGVSQAGPQNGGRERDDFQLTNGLLHWDRDFARGALESSLYFVRSREQMDGPGILPNHKIGWKDDRHGLGVEETWTDAWSSGLAYTYLDARNTFTGLKVPVRPPHQGQFWNELRISQPVSLRVELTFRDAYWFDTANTLRAAAAPRLNAQLNYQVSPKLKLYVRGENLNGERSAELNGFGYPGAAVYAGFHAAL